MSLYKNKYRVESSRLKLWDYSSEGAYFITICTKDMVNYFGKIVNEKVILSSIGIIVNEEWLKTGVVRNYVTLDEYIVMPNHVHGIIFLLDKPNNVETPRWGVSNRETTHRVVSTTIKKGSISSIIGQYKSNCTKQIRESEITDFQWQTRFHDHIIRNERELYNIRKYIFNNPLKWSNDEYYNNTFIDSV
jgi:putative transposase